MPSDLGFLQELMLPGMVPQAQAPDPMEQIIRAGSQRIMGTSPLAPAVEEIVRNAAEKQRTGYGMLPPGVTPEMEQQGRANLAEWFGPQVAGALGLPHSQPSWQAGAGRASEPPLTEADLMAMAGAQPQPATSRSMGLSLPPGTDLSGFNRAVSGLGGIGQRMGEASRSGRKALGEAIGKQQAAVEKQAQIAAERQEAIAGEMGNLEAAMATQQEAQRAREQDVAKQVKGRVSAFNQAVEAANSATIDPDRWYRDSEGGTFGRRLGSAVAMALGAVGSAFTRGPNYAMQIIQSAIDRDLMSQRAELAKKQAGVGMAQNAVQMAREQFSDEQARGAAEQAAMLSRAQRMIALSTAQSGSKEKIAEGEALSADLGVRAAELMGKAEQAEAAGEWTRQTQLAGLELQGAQIKGADAKLRWQAQQRAAGPSAGGLRGLVPADPANPPSKAQMAEAQKSFAKYQRVQTAIARAIQLRASEGWKLKTPREQKAVLSQLASAMADYQGLPGESKKKVFSDPASVIGISDLGEVGSVLDHLRAMQQSVRADFEAGMGAAGGGGLVLQDVAAMPGARRVR